MKRRRFIWRNFFVRVGVANYPRGALAFFDRGLGMYVRNNLGLWAYAKMEPGFNPGWKWRFIAEAMWDRLNELGTFKDILRDPNTGEELPEEFRYLNYAEYYVKVLIKRRSQNDRTERLPSRPSILTGNYCGRKLDS